MPTEILEQLKVLRANVAEALKKDPRYLTLQALDKSIAEIGGVLSASGLLPAEKTSAAAPQPLAGLDAPAPAAAPAAAAAAPAKAAPAEAKKAEEEAEDGEGDDEEPARPAAALAASPPAPAPAPTKGSGLAKAAGIAAAAGLAALAVGVAASSSASAHEGDDAEETDADEKPDAEAAAAGDADAADAVEAGDEGADEAATADADAEGGEADGEGAEGGEEAGEASADAADAGDDELSDEAEASAEGDEDGEAKPAPFAAASSDGAPSVVEGRSSGYRAMAARAEAPEYAPGISIKYAKLPNRVDLRSLMTPVENQGQTNSCVANAVAGAWEYWVKRATRQQTDVSRLFVYYNARWRGGDQDKDEGAVIQLAMESLAKFGACPEKAWPFDKRLILQKPGAEAYREAHAQRVQDMAKVPLELDAWKQALAEGRPIVFGVALFKSFDEASKRGGVVPMPSPEDVGRASHGGHAMCAVGYNEAERVFIVRNSWGAEWGDKGYCYMPYDYLMNPKFNFGDSWVFVPRVPLPPPREVWSDTLDPVTNDGRGVDFPISPFKIDDYASIVVDLFADAILPFRTEVTEEWSSYVSWVSEGRWSMLETFDVATYLEETSIEVTTEETTLEETSEETEEEEETSEEETEDEEDSGDDESDDDTDDEDDSDDEDDDSDDEDSEDDEDDEDSDEEDGDDDEDESDEDESEDEDASDDEDSDDDEESEDDDADDDSEEGDESEDGDDEEDGDDDSEEDDSEDGDDDEGDEDDSDGDDDDSDEDDSGDDEDDSEDDDSGEDDSEDDDDGGDDEEE